MPMRIIRDMVPTKLLDASLLTLAALMLLTAVSCQRAKTAGNHIIVIENRSADVVICDEVSFDGSVVGGLDLALRPGAKNTNPNHDWQITDHVDIDAGIYPNDGTLGTDRFDRSRIERRKLSCDVLRHMSRSDRQLLWFIVEPDLTLRLVVLPGERFAEMERSGERPK